MSDSDGVRVLADNRRARHNYHLLEFFQVGMVLVGTEVKSARNGKIQLADAYGAVKDNELWLLNAHIGPYSHGNLQNHDPVRPRKLLAHRREISRLDWEDSGKRTYVDPDPDLFTKRAHQVRPGAGASEKALRQARKVQAPRGGIGGTGGHSRGAIGHSCCETQPRPRNLSRFLPENRSLFQTFSDLYR